MNRSNTSIVEWKPFVITTIESLIAFYIATFCIAMFFIHHGSAWMSLAIILGLLYLFVIFMCGKRVLEKMSMATVFLIIPIAPLIALIIVVSLIPLLQFFK